MQDFTKSFFDLFIAKILTAGLVCSNDAYGIVLMDNIVDFSLCNARWLRGPAKKAQISLLLSSQKSPLSLSVFSDGSCVGRDRKRSLVWIQS